MQCTIIVYFICKFTLQIHKRVNMCKFNQPDIKKLELCRPVKCSDQRMLWHEQSRGSHQESSSECIRHMPHTDATIPPRGDQYFTTIKLINIIIVTLHTPCPKTLSKIVFVELRQISTKFDNFWAQRWPRQQNYEVHSFSHSFSQSYCC